jgi:DNA-binding NtrC family response regulator
VPEALKSAGMAGSGPAMQQLDLLVRQVAPTDLSVLINGESGTGKELIARAIHQLSRRSAGPLITVNCGAIPEGIFESEIFGHERGSFTGAERQRKGMFELADGGTIFLDEIGEMPLFTQVKILRVLETGEFMRVGGQSPIRVNVRVVAATNRDLAAEAARGRFREDLYFRLKAINLVLPPLRERSEDIPELVEHFAGIFCEQNHLPRPFFAAEAMEALRHNRWQGNVRELKNQVESLCILAAGGVVTGELVAERLSHEQRPAMLPALRDTNEAPASGVSLELLQQMFFYLQRELGEIKTMLREQMEHQRQVDEQLDLSSMSVEELERDHIRETLQEFGGNRSRAARALGISERTLYRKIHKYGL